MIRKRRSVAFLAALVFGPFALQAEATTYVFSNITSFHQGVDNYSITGFLSDSTTATVTYDPVTNSVLYPCAPLITYLIDHQGSWTLTIETAVTDPVLGGRTVLSSCTLNRVTGVPPGLPGT